MQASLRKATESRDVPWPRTLFSCQKCSGHGYLATNSLPQRFPGVVLEIRAGHRPDPAGVWCRHTMWDASFPPFRPSRLETLENAWIFGFAITLVSDGSYIISNKLTLLLLNGYFCVAQSAMSPGVVLFIKSLWDFFPGRGRITITLINVNWETLSSNTFCSAKVKALQKAM